MVRHGLTDVFGLIRHVREKCYQLFLIYFFFLFLHRLLTKYLRTPSAQHMAPMDADHVQGLHEGVGCAGGNPIGTALERV